MNKAILFTVPTLALLLNSINANSATLTIYDSDNSTPFVSLNSPYLDMLDDYNNKVYLNNATAGSKVKEFKNAAFAALVFIGNPSQAAVKLGQGMDPDLDSMAGQCIDGTEITPASTTRADISIDGSYTRNSFLKDFAAGANGGATWGAFSGSASGGYARLTQEDDLSLVYMYKSAYRLGSKSLINYTIAAGNPIKTAEDLKHFRNKCGDRFVKEIVLGGSLFYTVKLNFENYADKLTVKAAVRASFLTFGGGGSFSKVTQSIENKGSITVSVSQSGGDVTKLGTALSKATDSIQDSQIVCDFSDMKMCGMFVDSLAEYAATSFPEQLNDNKEANVIGTSYLQYRVAGVPSLPPPLNLTNDVFKDSVWLNRVDIASQLGKNVVNLDTAERLKAYLNEIADPLAKEIYDLQLAEESLKIVSNRQLELEAINTKCWTDPLNCSNGIDIFKLKSLKDPRNYILQPEHLALLKLSLR